MKTIISLTLGSLLTLSALAAENGDLKQKIQELNDKMAKAVVDGKPTESLNLYAEDAISLPNYSPILKGKEAIKKHHQEMETSGIKFHSFDLTTMMIKEAGDLIHEIGTYTLSMSIPGAPERIQDKGKYLTIWKKESDGSLKIVTETWNTDSYPMMGQ